MWRVHNGTRHWRTGIMPTGSGDPCLLERHACVTRLGLGLVAFNAARMTSVTASG